MGLTETYDMLGVAVRVEVPDDAAGARIGELLRDAPTTDRPPVHVLRLEQGADGMRTLSQDGEVVRPDMEPPMSVSVLLWAVHQAAMRTDRFVVLHAGCVALGGRGYLLPGEREVGKSTLVTGLVRDGFSYLSDELGAISLEDNLLYPHARPIGLDPGSFPSFQELEPRTTADFADDRRWHLRADDVRPGSRSEPVPPAAVVFPRYVPGTEPAIEPVRRPEALWLLGRSAVNLDVLGRRGFTTLGDIAASIPAYRLTSGSLEDACRMMRSLDSSDSQGVRLPGEAHRTLWVGEERYGW